MSTKPLPQADINDNDSKNGGNNVFHIDDEMVENMVVDTKDNLYLESLRTLLEDYSCFDEIPVDDTGDDSLENPRSCPLCDVVFKNGDEMCRSKKDKSNLVYHEECILEWLMHEQDNPILPEEYFEL